MKSKARTLLERARQFRREPTRGEARLWEALRNRRMGVRFYRQHVIGPFIADFICLSARLIVEVDGPVHAERLERDRARDDWLSIKGFRVMRVTADDIEYQLASVLKLIEARIVESR